MAWFFIPANRVSSFCTTKVPCAPVLVALCPVISTAAPPPPRPRLLMRPLTCVLGLVGWAQGLVPPSLTTWLRCKLHGQVPPGLGVAGEAQTPALLQTLYSTLSTSPSPSTSPSSTRSVGVARTMPTARRASEGTSVAV